MGKRALLVAASALGLALLTPFPPGPSCEIFPLEEENFLEIPRENSDDFTVVSLNLAAEKDPAVVLQDLRQARLADLAQIFLLQEVVSSAGNPLPQTLARELKCQLVYAPADRFGDSGVSGLAILSRFPLRDPAVLQLPRYDLRFKKRCRIALDVTLEGGNTLGPLRVFNLHLDSRINQNRRLRQLEPVLRAAETAGGPKVIGGDFNTANVFWIRHLLPLPFLQPQADTLLTEMHARGYTTPFTETGSTFSYLPLKLDWVFLRQLRMVDAGLRRIPFSDHHALWARVRREPN